MDHTAVDEVPRGSELEGQEISIEIRVLTASSQTYSLRVDKEIPILELKERIASVTGVPSAHQRLICQGHILKDDQLLSKYNIVNQHTVHLVIREPVPAPVPVRQFSEGSSSSQQPPGLSWNDVIPEVGEGSWNINQLISSQIGVLQVLRHIFSTRPRVPGIGLLVVPDCPTILSQYLRDWRHYSYGNSDETLRGESNSETDPVAAQRRHRRLLLLVEALLATREMLIGDTEEDLIDLSEEFLDPSNHVDPRSRERTQLYASTAARRFQNLGSFFLDLARTIVAVPLGSTRSPTENDAGPALVIPPLDPNPVMPPPVQPDPQMNPAAQQTDFRALYVQPPNVQPDPEMIPVAQHTDSTLVNENVDEWFLNGIQLEISRYNGPPIHLPDLDAFGRLTVTQGSQSSGETRLTSDQIGTNSVLESGAQQTAGCSSNATFEPGYAPASSTRRMRLRVPYAETVGEPTTATIALPEIYQSLQELFPGRAIYVEEVHSQRTSTDSTNNTDEPTP